MGYRLVKSGDQTVELHLSGPRDAPSLLIFHVGMPSAATTFPALTAAAAARGIRTAIYSRPGYARSSRDPGRTVADEARRSAEIADLLGYRSFLVAGWSGGGPAALACAALLPDRVTACLTLASPAPRLEAMPGWTEWTSPEDAQELEILAAGRGAEVLPSYHEAAAIFQRITPHRLISMGGGTAADHEAILGSSRVGRALARSMRRAVSAGIWGWFDDAIAQANDWGFRVADIRVPVVIRHGELDRLVDVRQGRWLAAAIPGADAEFLPNAGHSAVTHPFDAVVDRLVRAGGAAAGV